MDLGSIVVVGGHGVRIAVPGAGKDGGSRVNHHRAAVLLCGRVDLAQGFVSVPIGVGGEDLMRRMDLEHPDSGLEETRHIGPGVARAARMDRAHRDEPVFRAFDESANPVIGLFGEAHDVRSDIVDQSGALDPLVVHQGEQLPRISSGPVDSRQIQMTGGHRDPRRRL